MTIKEAIDKSAASGGREIPNVQLPGSWGETKMLQEVRNATQSTEWSFKPIGINKHGEMILIYSTNQYNPYRIALIFPAPVLGN